MDIKHLQKPSKVIFLEEDEIKRELRDLEKDIRFDTSPLTKRAEDNSIIQISFFKKHLTYLKTHPKVNPSEYISNLRTMTRIRQ